MRRRTVLYLILLVFVILELRTCIITHSANDPLNSFPFNPLLELHEDSCVKVDVAINKSVLHYDSLTIFFIWQKNSLVRLVTYKLPKIKSKNITSFGDAAVFLNKELFDIVNPINAKKDGLYFNPIIQFATEKVNCDYNITSAIYTHSYTEMHKNGILLKLLRDRKEENEEFYKILFINRYIISPYHALNAFLPNSSTNNFVEILSQDYVIGSNSSWMKSVELYKCLFSQGCNRDLNLFYLHLTTEQLKQFMALKKSDSLPDLKFLNIIPIGKNINAKNECYIGYSQFLISNRGFDPNPELLLGNNNDLIIYKKLILSRELEILKVDNVDWQDFINSQCN